MLEVKLKTKLGRGVLWSRGISALPAQSSSSLVKEEELVSSIEDCLRDWR